MIMGRIRALQAVMRTCLNWYTLLRIYFLGGAGTIYLRDAFRNKIDVHVEPSNISKILFLTTILNDLFSYYRFLCENGKRYIFFYSEAPKLFGWPNPVDVDAIFHDWKLQDLLSAIRFTIMNSDSIGIRPVKK